MFGVIGVLLTIYPPGIISLSFMVPSTRRQSHWVLLASLWLFHPPGIFSFSSMTCLTGLYWVILAFFWTFHPPRITSSFYMETALPCPAPTILYQRFSSWRLNFYPFHLNLDRSPNTAFSFHVQQTLCLLLPCLHQWFIFMLMMMMISNDIWKSLWSCHPWRQSSHL